MESSKIKTDLHSSRKDADLAGASWYFTGYPCKHGHLAPRLTVSGSCKECSRLRQKRRETDPVYREAKRKRTTEWKRKHRAKVNETRRNWHLAHKDEENRKSIEYYRKHKPKIAEKRKEKTKINPLRSCAATLRSGISYRSKKFNIPVDAHRKTIAFMFEKLSNQPNCICCGKPFDFSRYRTTPRDDSPSIDKLIPENGYIDGNTFIICFRCNALKRDATRAELQTILEYIDAKTI
jgi:hypothetical protein